MAKIGRPSKMPNFIKAFEQVIKNDEFDVVILTDSELLMECNELLEEKHQIADRTFESWKSGAYEGKYKEFYDIYSKIGRNPRKMTYVGININSKDNKQYQREYHNQYYHKKQKNNNQFRIRNSISTLLRHHIKNKTNKTFDLLGYSINELCIHLEKNFKNGMTWDNYGAYWHIDHIRPASWFNMEDINEFNQCWSLKNLQPLEASINCKKQNYYEG